MNKSENIRNKVLRRYIKIYSNKDRNGLARRAKYSIKLLMTWEISERKRKRGRRTIDSKK